MTVGEKIKYYRSKKNLDVKELSQRSGISADAIRKYEQGQRKPKYEQLQKLATGLQISLNNFLDLEILSQSDLIPYLITIGKKGEIRFHGEKDSSGNYTGTDLCFSFNSPDLQNFLKEWANKQNTINKLKYEADHTPDEKVRFYLLKRIKDLETELETFTI